MRFFSILLAGLLATSAVHQTAIAQTPECKSIADPAARLVCYDKSSQPATSTGAVRPVQRALPTSKIDGAKYVDSISAEDAAMHEKIKGICRGC